MSKNQPTTQKRTGAVPIIRPSDNSNAYPAQSSDSPLPLKVRSVNLKINSTVLLKDINLNITDHKITMLMGHNGAGKSLLIRALHGIITPQSGTIEWNTLPAADAATREQQSMVFQKPVLLRRSVAANIDYVLALRNLTSKPRRNELLAMADLLDKSGQAARSLSGGEQQRLAIVRALATNPKVLLLDEPTASLDPNATLQIENLIRASSEQLIKIIMVTHDVAQAKRLANDVVFLSDGEIAEHSGASTFFNNPTSTAGHSYMSGYLPQTL